MEIKTDKLNGRPRVTITDGTRILTVISISPSSKELDIGKFTAWSNFKLDHATGEGYVVNGSMSLMADLGWISPSELGGFEDLIFDPYGRTAIVGGLTVRFGRNTDISIFKDANIVKICDPCKSWSEITLSNGLSFDGQPKASLLELARMGLVEDVNIQALEKLEAAKEVIRQANKDYKDLVRSLGGEFHESGDYEDYEYWYSIPGVPGCW